MNCECGCGELAPIADHTCSRRGWVKGQPKRFIDGHWNDVQKRRNGEGIPVQNPSDECFCGCGEITSLYKKNNRRRGYKKGTHTRYIKGHEKRAKGPRWIENPETECWEWQLYRNRDGYGALSGALAHRVIYEEIRGSIPEGHHLDHLCCNKGCVNPEHLEPVTPWENQRRGWVRISNTMFTQEN